MTPLILMSLLSIGLVGLIFVTNSDDSSDIDQADETGRDEAADDRTDLIPLSNSNAEGVEADAGSPNLPDDESPDQSEAENNVYIALTNNTDVSGNTLSGGSGDDYIRTSRLPDYDGATSLNWFAAHLGAGGNLVFGGAGDDTVEMSPGDTAFGGVGDDTFIIVSDPVAIDPSESGAEIHDFEQGSDIIFVQLPPAEPGSINQSSEYDIHSHIVINFDGDNTNIYFHGKPLLILKGLHDVSVGVQEDAERDVPISDIHNISNIRGLHLVDLDGRPLAGDAPDIIVSRYMGL